MMRTLILFVVCIVRRIDSNAFANLKLYNQDVESNAESNDNNDGSKRGFNPFGFALQAISTPIKIAKNTIGVFTGSGDGSSFSNYFSGIFDNKEPDTTDYRPDQELNDHRLRPPSSGPGTGGSQHNGRRDVLISDGLDLDPNEVHLILKRMQGHPAASNKKLDILYAKINIFEQ